MNDPLMTVWESLLVEKEHAIRVEGNVFEYPKEKRYIKGVFESERFPGHPTRFMSFHSEMDTIVRGKLENTDKTVITFYQVGDGSWVYAMSEGDALASFADPMQCCHHAVELAQKLARGESADMHLRDGDNRPFTVRMKPLEVELN
jgi:hypothetical protein